MFERKSILVVDDELGPRESLRMILKDQYDISTASTGREALEKLSVREHDLVILDIKMPGMNGMEVLQEIKQKTPETGVVLITAYASVETAKNALKYGALDYLIKPFDRKDLNSVVERGLKVRAERLGEKQEMQKLQIATAELNQEVETARRNIEQHYAVTVKSLLANIDARDQYTRAHSERVSRFVAFLAEKMGMGPEKILSLEQAALIHDIGNIGVEAAILTKQGTLTAGEFSEIKKHPLIGAKIIAPVEFLREMMPVVLHHHERYDGTGFPDGLHGKEIPLSARLVAVADAIDAMFCARPYRSALTLEAIREEVVRTAGKQFDPEIIDMALSGGVLECYTGIFSY